MGAVVCLGSGDQGAAQHLDHRQPRVMKSVSPTAILRGQPAVAAPPGAPARRPA